MGDTFQIEVVQREQQDIIGDKYSDKPFYRKDFGETEIKQGSKIEYIGNAIVKEET